MNPGIVIATPSQLIDNIEVTPSFNLEKIEVLIVDEADKMPKEAFMKQMKEILRSCARTRHRQIGKRSFETNAPRGAPDEFHAFTFLKLPSRFHTILYQH